MFLLAPVMTTVGVSSCNCPTLVVVIILSQSDLFCRCSHVKDRNHYDEFC